MPSAKQSKRRRAVQAPPPPVAKRRQASPRVLLAAALLAGAIVLAIILVVVLTGRGSGSGGVTSVTKLADAPDVRQQFTRIPQQGQVLGKPTAPVTMIEYIDLQCPYCQEFETTAMPNVISDLVRQGKLRVEARPIAIIGPDSLLGQIGRASCRERV